MRASSSRGTERLGQIVIRAELQPHDPIGLLGATGEDDDRDLRLGAQLSQQLHAVLAAQPQVQQHQIHHTGTEASSMSCVPLAQPVTRKSLCPRYSCTSSRIAAVVIDHQDVRYRQAAHVAVPP